MMESEKFSAKKIIITVVIVILSVILAICIFLAISYYSTTGHHPVKNQQVRELAGKYSAIEGVERVDVYQYRGWLEIDIYFAKDITTETTYSASPEILSLAKDYLDKETIYQLKSEFRKKYPPDTLIVIRRTISDSASDYIYEHQGSCYDYSNSVNPAEPPQFEEYVWDRYYTPDEDTKPQEVAEPATDNNLDEDEVKFPSKEDWKPTYPEYEDSLDWYVYPADYAGGIGYYPEPKDSKGYVNVREKPSIDARVIGELRQNDNGSEWNGVSEIYIDTDGTFHDGLYLVKSDVHTWIPVEYVGDSHQLDEDVAPPPEINRGWVDLEDVQLYRY